jgi:FkbM family methyltransferase
VIADVGHAVGDRLGRRGLPVQALRAGYARCLAAVYGRRGLPWRVNGESFRIDPAVRHLLPHENEPDLFGFLREHIEPGQYVLDLGAFLGTYAVLAARRAGPTGRVLAVEPSPWTFERLLRHLAMNGCAPPQVVPHCAAVGAALGRSAIVTFDAEPYRNMVAPQGARGVPVDVVTVDSLCERWGRPPDWIRMDVQGQEFEVLRGAREVLREGRGRTRLVVEMHPEQWPEYGIQPAEAEDRLTALGLRARPVTPGRDPFEQGGHALLEC